MAIGQRVEARLQLGCVRANSGKLAADLAQLFVAHERSASCDQVVFGLEFHNGALSGCGLGAALESCPDCGQVRLIEPRVVRDIRLYTRAPEPYRVGDADTATQPVVFHVRVHMDRGGARDFTLLSRASFSVGDRVEVSSGELIARNDAAAYRWQ